MDAYSDFLRQLAEQRLTQLRREATEDRLAQWLTEVNGTSRTRRGFGLRARLQRRAARRAPAGPMQEVVTIHRPSARKDTEVRRSA